MRHYDLGIVGCWYWGNFGSLLNGYATFSILKELNYNPLNIITPFNSFEDHAKKFFDAVYKKEDISATYSFDQLSDLNKICDSFITGSDQIWHHRPEKTDRKYDYFFRLNFTDDNKKRISYATSLGKIINDYDNAYVNYRSLYDRYDAISLREYQAVEFFKKKYGIEAKHLIEPVLVVPVDKWNELSVLSSQKFDGDFIFTYILDPTPEKKNLIKKICDYTKLNCYNILDGFSSTFKRNKQKLGLPNVIENAWSADLLLAFRKAKYVVTDSFHGTCFSILFNKPFISITNHTRGTDRFTSLLSELSLSNRLIDNDKLSSINLTDFLDTVSFNEINNKISKRSEESISWLKDAIEKPKSNIGLQKRPKISIDGVLSKLYCMGCGACVSICPHNAISLTPDETESYRASVDAKKCTNCGVCVNACAALESPINLNTNSPEAYSFINNKKSVLKDSSSGGIFSACADWILENGGVVVGAKWKTNHSLEHSIIKTKKDLTKLRRSKYLQSYMGTTIKEIKKTLASDVPVLFVGTPCQVAGIKKFFVTPQKNLFLIDTFCAHCSAAGLFTKYFDEKYNNDDVKRFDFRCKDNAGLSWHHTSSVTMKSGEKKYLSRDNDSYLKMFHSCSLGIASQCLKCKYQGTKRIGDISIGDCWGIEKFDPSVDSTQGVSAVLVNNDKGSYLIEEIRKCKAGQLKKQKIENIKTYNRLAFFEKRNWNRSLRSKTFWESLKTSTFDEAVTKAVNVEIQPIDNIKIDELSNDAVIISWEKSDKTYVTGYIIETYSNNTWNIEKIINDKNIEKHSIVRRQPLGESQEIRIRIKIYYQDESAKLFSKYKETQIMIN